MGKQFDRVRRAPPVTLISSSFNHATTLGVGFVLIDCDQFATVHEFDVARLYSVASVCKITLVLFSCLLYVCSLQDCKGAFIGKPARPESLCFAMQVADRDHQNCAQQKDSDANLGQGDVARKRNQHSRRELSGGITDGRLNNSLKHQRSLGFACAVCCLLSTCLEHDNMCLSCMLPSTCSLGLACAIL